MNIQVYHGSVVKFDKFEFDFVSKKDLNTGLRLGFYFSEMKADALSYGPILYTCNLNLKTSISNITITLKEKQLKKILDKLELFEDDEGLTKSYYENFNNDKKKAIDFLLTYNKSDVDILNDIINTCGAFEEIIQIMCELGFTHTTDNRTCEVETITHYIVYDPNIITITKIEPILVDL